jgi:hypothetical protein
MPNTQGSFNSLVINNTGTGANIARGSASVAGNITGGNLITTGVVASTGNVNSLGHVNAVANINGGNLNSAGRINAVGNIQGGNVFALNNISAINGTIYATFGNITNLSTTNLTVGTLSQTNVSATGFVSAAGNVSGRNLLSNGNVVVSGFVTSGGNLTGSNVNAVNVVATNTVRGSNVIASGNVVAGAFLNTNGTPYQSPGGPAFMATITSGQGLVTSPVSITQRTLIFNNVSRNIDNGYNSITGRFTAPRSGFYQVSGACSIVPTNLSQVLNYYGEAVFGIYKNNIPVAAGQFIDARGAIIGGVAIGALSASSVSILVDLNLNDILECKIAYITNAPTNFWNTYANIIPNYFQACWLRSL